MHSQSRDVNHNERTRIEICPGERRISEIQLSQRLREWASVERVCLHGLSYFARRNRKRTDQTREPRRILRESAVGRVGVSIRLLRPMVERMDTEPVTVSKIFVPSPLYAYSQRQSAQPRNQCRLSPKRRL